jgi:hypothetical protein
MHEVFSYYRLLLVVVNARGIGGRHDMMIDVLMIEIPS